VKAAVVVVGLALAGLGAPPARALVVAGEDDLSVVRRAVAHAGAGGSSEEVPAVRPEEPRKAAARVHRVKVRITEKGKGTKVAVDLPLAFLQGLGADIPVRWYGTENGRPTRGQVRLGDILEMLGSGEDFVKIDAEGATIRVFVD
jgi:hypothetical protein